MVSCQKSFTLQKYSTRTGVKSGISTGSGLGHLLFIIFIDDISYNFFDNVSIFDDNIKIMGIVNNKESIVDKMICQGFLIVQLNGEMPFNISKCQALHMRHENSHASYYFAIWYMALKTKSQICIKFWTNLKSAFLSVCE